MRKRDSKHGHSGVSVGLRAETPEQVQLWYDAAAKAGMPFAQWARAMLTQLATPAANTGKRPKPRGPAKAT